MFYLGEKLRRIENLGLASSSFKSESSYTSSSTTCGKVGFENLICGEIASNYPALVEDFIP